MNDNLTINEYLKVYKWPLLLFVFLVGLTYYKIVFSMIGQWNQDPNYSHGFLIPFVSAYFLYQKWEDIKSLIVRPRNSGLIIIVGSLLLLIVAYAGTEYFSMRSSMLFLISGAVLYWFGWEILKGVALPLGYLLFMVPVPAIIYDYIAFPLKLLITKYSVWSLKLMGVVVWCEGNIIMFPQTVLEVADACSGIRSLLSLLALSVALAVFSQRTLLKRFLLIVAAIPIAIVTNMFRVIATGFLAQYYGAAAAEGFFHEFAGMAVFVLAMLLLVVTSILLNRVWRR